jgi:hypothetical protein
MSSHPNNALLRQVAVTATLTNQMRHSNLFATVSAATDDQYAALQTALTAESPDQATIDAAKTAIATAHATGALAAKTGIANFSFILPASMAQTAGIVKAQVDAEETGHTDPIKDDAAPVIRDSDASAANRFSGPTAPKFGASVTGSNIVLSGVQVKSVAWEDTDTKGKTDTVGTVTLTFEFNLVKEGKAVVPAVAVDGPIMSIMTTLLEGETPRRSIYSSDALRNYVVDTSLAQINGYSLNPASFENLNGCSLKTLAEIETSAPNGADVATFPRGNGFVIGLLCRAYVEPGPEGADDKIKIRGLAFSPEEGNVVPGAPVLTNWITQIRVTVTSSDADTLHSNFILDIENLEIGTKTLTGFKVGGNSLKNVSGAFVSKGSVQWYNHTNGLAFVALAVVGGKILSTGISSVFQAYRDLARLQYDADPSVATLATSIGADCGRPMLGGAEVASAVKGTLYPVELSAGVEGEFMPMDDDEALGMAKGDLDQGELPGTMVFNGSSVLVSMSVAKAGAGSLPENLAQVTTIAETAGELVQTGTVIDTTGSTSFSETTRDNRQLIRNMTTNAASLGELGYFTDNILSVDGNADYPNNTLNDTGKEIIAYYGSNKKTGSGIPEFAGLGRGEYVYASIVLTTRQIGNKNLAIYAVFSTAPAVGYLATPTSPTTVDADPRYVCLKKAGEEALNSAVIAHTIDIAAGGSQEAAKRVILFLTPHYGDDFFAVGNVGKTMTSTGTMDQATDFPLGNGTTTYTDVVTVDSQSEVHTSVLLQSEWKRSSADCSETDKKDVGPGLVKGAILGGPEQVRLPSRGRPTAGPNYAIPERAAVGLAAVDVRASCTAILGLSAMKKGLPLDDPVQIFKDNLATYFTAADAWQTKVSADKSAYATSFRQTLAHSAFSSALTGHAYTGTINAARAIPGLTDGSGESRGFLLTYDQAYSTASAPEANKIKTGLIAIIDKAVAHANDSSVVGDDNDKRYFLLNWCNSLPGGFFLETETFYGWSWNTKLYEDFYTTTGMTGGPGLNYVVYQEVDGGGNSWLKLTGEPAYGCVRDTVDSEWEGCQGTRKFVVLVKEIVTSKKGNIETTTTKYRIVLVMAANGYGSGIKYEFITGSRSNATDIDASLRSTGSYGSLARAVKAEIEANMTDGAVPIVVEEPLASDDAQTTFPSGAEVHFMVILANDKGVQDLPAAAEWQYVVNILPEKEPLGGWVQAAGSVAALSGSGSKREVCFNARAATASDGDVQLVRNDASCTSSSCDQQGRSITNAADAKPFDKLYDPLKALGLRVSGTAYYGYDTKWYFTGGLVNSRPLLTNSLGGALCIHWLQLPYPDLLTEAPTPVKEAAVGDRYKLVSRTNSDSAIKRLNYGGNETTAGDYETTMATEDGMTNVVCRIIAETGEHYLLEDEDGVRKKVPKGTGTTVTPVKVSDAITSDAMGAWVMADNVDSWVEGGDQSNAVFAYNFAFKSEYPKVTPTNDGQYPVPAPNGGEKWIFMGGTKAIIDGGGAFTQITSVADGRLTMLGDGYYKQWYSALPPIVVEGPHATSTTISGTRTRNEVDIDEGLGVLALFKDLQEHKFKVVVQCGLHQAARRAGDSVAKDTPEALAHLSIGVAGRFLALTTVAASNPDAQQKLANMNDDSTEYFKLSDDDKALFRFVDVNHTAATADAPIEPDKDYVRYVGRGETGKAGDTFAGESQAIVIEMGHGQFESDKYGKMILCSGQDAQVVVTPMERSGAILTRTYNNFQVFASGDKNFSQATIDGATYMGNAGDVLATGKSQDFTIKFGSSNRVTVPSPESTIALRMEVTNLDDSSMKFILSGTIVPKVVADALHQHPACANFELDDFKIGPCKTAMRPGTYIDSSAAGFALVNLDAGLTASTANSRWQFAPTDAGKSALDLTKTQAPSALSSGSPTILPVGRYSVTMSAAVVTELKYVITRRNPEASATPAGRTAPVAIASDCGLKTTAQTVYGPGTSLTSGLRFAFPYNDIHISYLVSDGTLSGSGESAIVVLSDTLASVAATNSPFVAKPSIKLTYGTKSHSVLVSDLHQGQTINLGSSFWTELGVGAPASISSLDMCIVPDWQQGTDDTTEPKPATSETCKRTALTGALTRGYDTTVSGYTGAGDLVIRKELQAMNSDSSLTLLPIETAHTTQRVQIVVRAELNECVLKNVRLHRKRKPVPAQIREAKHQSGILTITYYSHDTLPGAGDEVKVRDVSTGIDGTHTVKTVSAETNTITIDLDGSDSQTYADVGIIETGAHAADTTFGVGGNAYVELCGTGDDNHLSSYKPKNMDRLALNVQQKVPVQASITRTPRTDSYNIDSVTFTYVDASALQGYIYEYSVIAEAHTDDNLTGAGESGKFVDLTTEAGDGTTGGTSVHNTGPVATATAEDHGGSVLYSTVNTKTISGLTGSLGGQGATLTVTVQPLNGYVGPLPGAVSIAVVDGGTGFKKGEKITIGQGSALGNTQDITIEVGSISAAADGTVSVTVKDDFGPVAVTSVQPLLDDAKLGELMSLEYNTSDDAFTAKPKINGQSMSEYLKTFMSNTKFGPSLDEVEVKCKLYRSVSGGDDVGATDRDGVDLAETVSKVIDSVTNGAAPTFEDKSEFEWKVDATVAGGAGARKEYYFLVSVTAKTGLGQVGVQGAAGGEAGGQVATDCGSSNAGNAPTFMLADPVVAGTCINSATINLPGAGAKTTPTLAFDKDGVTSDGGFLLTNVSVTVDGASAGDSVVTASTALSGNAQGLITTLCTNLADAETGKFFTPTIVLTFTTDQKQAIAVAALGAAGAQLSGFVTGTSQTHTYTLPLSGDNSKVAGMLKDLAFGTLLDNTGAAVVSTPLVSTTSGQVASPSEKATTECRNVPSFSAETGATAANIAGGVKYLTFADHGVVTARFARNPDTVKSGVTLDISLPVKATASGLDIYHMVNTRDSVDNAFLEADVDVVAGSPFVVAWHFDEDIKLDTFEDAYPGITLRDKTGQALSLSDGQKLLTLETKAMPTQTVRPSIPQVGGGNFTAAFMVSPIAFTAVDGTASATAGDGLKVGDDAVRFFKPGSFGVTVGDRRIKVSKKAIKKFLIDELPDDTNSRMARTIKVSYGEVTDEFVAKRLIEVTLPSGQSGTAQKRCTQSDGSGVTAEGTWITTTQIELIAGTFVKDVDITTAGVSGTVTPTNVEEVVDEVDVFPLPYITKAIVDANTDAETGKQLRDEFGATLKFNYLDQEGSDMFSEPYEATNVMIVMKEPELDVDDPVTKINGDPGLFDKRIGKLLHTCEQKNFGPYLAHKNSTCTAKASVAVVDSDIPTGSSQEISLVDVGGASLGFGVDASPALLAGVSSVALDSDDNLAITTTQPIGAASLTRLDMTLALKQAYADRQAADYELSEYSAMAGSIVTAVETARGTPSALGQTITDLENNQGMGSLKTDIWNAIESDYSGKRHVFDVVMSQFVILGARGVEPMMVDVSSNDWLPSAATTHPLGVFSGYTPKRMMTNDGDTNTGESAFAQAIYFVVTRSIVGTSANIDVTAAVVKAEELGDAVLHPNGVAPAVMIAIFTNPPSLMVGTQVDQVRSEFAIKLITKAPTIESGARTVAGTTTGTQYSHSADHGWKTVSGASVFSPSKHIKDFVTGNIDIGKYVLSQAMMNTASGLQGTELHPAWSTAYTKDATQYFLTAVSDHSSRRYGTDYPEDPYGDFYQGNSLPVSNTADIAWRIDASGQIEDPSAALSLVISKIAGGGVELIDGTAVKGAENDGVVSQNH